MDETTRRLLKAYKDAEDDTRVFRGESVAVAGRGAITGLQGGTLSEGVAVSAPVDWRTPLSDIKKRTPAQRAEALAQKFWQSVKDHDPAQTELVLKMLYQDSWKKGQPISYDEVKQLAVELLRTTAAKAGGPY